MKSGTTFTRQPPPPGRFLTVPKAVNALTPRRALCPALHILPRTCNALLAQASPPLPSYQARKFRNSVMMIALVKSMKNAPTIGATRKARGAGP